MRCEPSQHSAEVRQRSVEFSTSEFEFSHGRKPRGGAHWAFDFGHGPEFISGGLAYGPAKREARRIAARRFVNRVKVCP